MELATKLFEETRNATPENWLCIPIRGTTTSGDPAGTTLVNTIHSLMFDWLYLIEATGMTEPWKFESAAAFGFSNFAAGDDTFILARESLADSIEHAIIHRTSSSKAH